MANTAPITLPRPPQGKYVLFLGDTHLGSRAHNHEETTERRMVTWLQKRTRQLHALVLMGDIMDFWIEYKRLIPRYGQQLALCIQQLTQQRIPVYYLSGNHDAWVGTYWRNHLGVQVSRAPLHFHIGDKKLFAVHGDKFCASNWLMYHIKYHWVESRLAQHIVRLLPADWAFPALHYIFDLRRFVQRKDAREYTQKRLIDYIRRMEKQTHYDYYLFGHTHCAHQCHVDKTVYLNTGDFYTHGTHAILDAQLTLRLHTTQALASASSA